MENDDTSIQENTGFIPISPNNSISSLNGHIRKSGLTRDSHHMKPIEKEVHFVQQDSEIELTGSDPASSMSTDCDSSSTGSEDSERDEASQTSDPSQGKKLMLRSVPLLTYKRRQSMPQRESNGVNVYLAFRAREIWESGFGYSNGTIDYSNGAREKAMEQDEEDTGLVNVQLTADVKHKTENVPFVCLTSKLDGQAVIGYPVEVEVLSDSYETLPPRNKMSVMKLSDDDGSKLSPLVWRPAKRPRTPVCYVGNSVSCASGNTRPDSEASRNSMVMKERPLEKCKKNQIKFKKAATESCVPVERIFSKILAAIGTV